jgi:hypothetical protein
LRITSARSRLRASGHVRIEQSQGLAKRLLGAIDACACARSVKVPIRWSPDETRCCGRATPEFLWEARIKAPLDLLDLVEIGALPSIHARQCQ